MAKRLLLFLFLTAFCAQLANAAESTWKQLYDEGGKLLEQRKFSDARKKADAALAAAQKEFGPVSTHVGEVLYLQMAIEQAQGNNLDSPKIQDLLGQLRFIQSKVIEEKQATFSMNWRVGDPSKQWPEARHIILTFTDFPNFSIGIYSPDLGNYLEKSGKNPVNVVFNIKYDKSLKKISTFSETQIGEMTSWQNTASYASFPNSSPTPWDKLVEEWGKTDQVPGAKSPAGDKDKK